MHVGKDVCLGAIRIQRYMRHGPNPQKAPNLKGEAVPLQADLSRRGDYGECHRRDRKRSSCSAAGESFLIAGRSRELLLGVTHDTEIWF